MCPSPPRPDQQWTVCGRGAEIAKRRERISAMVVHAGLRERVSPTEVPLFSFEGGDVSTLRLNPSLKGCERSAAV